MVVLKDKRGKPGSRERGIHYSAATGALALKFGAARHFVPTSQEGETYTNSNYHNIQEMYVGNLHKLRGVLDHTIKYDMRDPFRVPSMIDTITADASLRWGDSTTSLDMLQHWSQISLDETKAFQRDTNLFASEEDMASSDWMCCSRSPGRMPCPNYEAVEFQPRTVDNSALDSGCPACIL